MLSFTEWKYIKLYLGDKSIRSHVDALHATRPNNDLYTGEIVERIIEEINCSGIIATVSRTKMDLNRPQSERNKEGIVEYRKAIREILQHVNILRSDGKISKPYLHLAIHGIKDDYGADIIIGTKYNETCSISVKNWLVSKVRQSEVFNNDRIFVDRIKPGDRSKSVHRARYGENFNTVQIELSFSKRKNNLNEIVSFFSGVIMEFNEKFK